MTWSAWESIEQRAGYAGCAVYRIRVVVGGEPVSMHRFLDMDRAGLLCIGQTANLHRRRGGFWRGVRLGHGHSEGNLLHTVRELAGFRTHFPDCACEYSYRPTCSREEAVRRPLRKARQAALTAEEHHAGRRQAPFREAA